MMAPGVRIVPPVMPSTRVPRANVKAGEVPPRVSVEESIKAPWVGKDTTPR